MAHSTLERYEARRNAEVAAAAEAKAERAARKALRQAVKAVIPKKVLAPTRRRGRGPTGGVSPREVAFLRARAQQFQAAGGLPALEAEVQHTALVILLIDGLLGTEPWRVPGHLGGTISASARFRYLENATRLLEDLRRSRGDRPLLEGVFDAEPASDSEGVNVPSVPEPKP